ncbi:hypothetical protein [Marivivens aquimaris]|uniref:hypothetical protein n=1 Tax=Marivivens aquimaris TaxID=2774876 RepID=UPI0018821DB0|nr:hypothetical protein [Marivivens aquimaris]
MTEAHPAAPKEMMEYTKGYRDALSTLQNIIKQGGDPSAYVDFALSSIEPEESGWYRMDDPNNPPPKDGTPILSYSDGCDDKREAFLVVWYCKDKVERSGFGWAAYEVSHMLSPNLWAPLPPPPTED